MITWQDLVKMLKTGTTPPFSLETVPELRRWCAAEFDVESQTVWVWMKTNRLPPHVRQQLVMIWPEIFHKIEFGENGARYEPKNAKADCSPQDHPCGRICQLGKGSMNV